MVDKCIRSKTPQKDLTEMVLSLAPIVILGQGKLSDDFWSAIKKDAQHLSDIRWKQCRPRALWGVTPIVMLNEFVHADRKCGYEAESLVFSTYYITSKFDHVLEKHTEEISGAGPELDRIFRWVCLIWVIMRYDVINLFNDRGIIEPAGGYGSEFFGIAIAEMDLYQEVGKMFYTHAYGADHRMREKTLASGMFNFCMDCPAPGTHCVCDDAGGKKMLAEIARRATVMFATGLAAEQIPGARNIYNLAVDTDRIRPPAKPRNPCKSASRSLRVGHFPNHGFFKGTRYLIAAIERLQKDGFAIELVQLSGLPQSEIINAMRDVDIVVDQLISGSFGLTGLEAMALAKPVICHLKDNVAIAESENCPVIRANPETIAGELRAFANSRRNELWKIGLESRAYVLRNYSIDAFASRLASVHAKHDPLPQLAGKALRQHAILLRNETLNDGTHWREFAKKSVDTNRPLTSENRTLDLRKIAKTKKSKRTSVSGKILGKVITIFDGIYKSH